MWEAIQRALDGSDESAWVSASKLLLYTLYEPTAATCPVCLEREANGPQVEAKLLDLLGRGHDEYERERHGA